MICRIATQDKRQYFDPMELAYPYIEVLKGKLGDALKIVNNSNFRETETDDEFTFLHVFSVQPGKHDQASGKTTVPFVTRHFYHRKAEHTATKPALLEITLARATPCLLSRQRAVITSDISATNV